MPYRKIALINNYYYHIFNRGVEKRNIFSDTRDYSHFLKILNYYHYQQVKPSFSRNTAEIIQNLQGTSKIVDIICYCFMPNHFHLLLKQLQDGGISEFIRKISDGYTRYFNVRHNRVGPLFQGPYKAVLIESDEQFAHVSRYIHLNPLVSGLVKNLSSYQWSSYPDYIDIRNSNLSNKKDVLDHFKKPRSYEKFVLDQADYALKLEQMKHKLLDIEF